LGEGLEPVSGGGDDREELRRLRRRVAELEDETEIARRLAAFEAGPAGRERIYRFIKSESGNFAVARLCQVCGVARSAYYDWLGRQDGPGEALIEEAYLANRIFDIWRRSRRRYGAPRVTAALRKQGVEVNEKRVARLMGELGITGKCGRRKIRTTWRDPGPNRPLTWWSGTSAPMNPMSCGWAISPIYRLMRAGCSWRRCWMCAPA
jgi:transposase